MCAFIENSYTFVIFVDFGEEVIQGILPKRVYQTTGALINLAGGILGELILITFRPTLIKGKESV